MKTTMIRIRTFGLGAIFLLALTPLGAAKAMPACERTLVFGPRPTSVLVPVGISNHHLHLSARDLEILFGPGYRLTPFKPLKQPGQWAANETVRLIGPKGVLENVRILGPERKETQVEISQTDAIRVGVKAPVRESGDLAGSAAIIVEGPFGSVGLDHGAILAARHIHLNDKDAEAYGLKDKDHVKVRTRGDRSMTYDNVLVRVSKDFTTELHLDTDEANAGLIVNGDQLELVF